jgi:hypothetical protein
MRNNYFFGIYKYIRYIYKMSEVTIEIVRFYDGTGEFTVTITDPSGDIIEKKQISTAITFIKQNPGILNVEVQVEVEVESEQTAKENIQIQAAVDTAKANIKTTIDETVCVSTRISETQARVENTINNLSLVLTRISEEVIQFTQENGIDICEFTVKRIFNIKFEEKQEDIAEKLEILANAFATAALFIEENDIQHMAIMLAVISNNIITSF